MRFLHNDTSRLSNTGVYGFIYALVNGIVTFLLAHGWTYFASSDGSTVSTSDNIFPPNYSVAYQLYSWITIKSPVGIMAGGTGYVWFTLALDTSSHLGMRIAMHRVEPTVEQNAQTPPTSSSMVMDMDGRIHSGYANIGVGTWYFNIVMWECGCWYAAIGLAGEGRFRCVLGLYPLSDINYNYAFPLAIKLSIHNSGEVMSDSTLDNLHGWNADGTVASSLFRLAFMGGAAGIIGYGLPSFGDMQGNNLHSKLYVYNPNAGSMCIIGKLGAENYDFGITGCSSIPNANVDASVPKHNFYDRLLLPANAVMMS